MRPTGKLHIGHYFGALSNWVSLQETYDSFYMVADWHALTTDYANTGGIIGNSREMVLDWLACGIDPERSVIFRQSDVPAHAELSMLLGMITPLGWLFRCPTYKEQLTEIKDKDLHNLGFLGYPVLQAADITLYMASAVPVGQDQLPHLELTREIVRRFNNLYGDVLIEPQAILAKSAKVPGLDMRKMSKSYGNAITIDEEPEAINNKLMKQAFTDPARARATDPGHPDGCAVFAYHQLFNPQAQAREAECKAGAIGCVACKKQCAQLMAEGLAAVREKRKALAAEKGLVESILEKGARRANEAAEDTMRKVRSALKLR